MPVVGDEDHGAGKIAQRAEKHVLGGEIQVVGGLVEDQEVRRPSRSISMASRLFSPRSGPTRS